MCAASHRSAVLRDRSRHTAACTTLGALLILLSCDSTPTDGGAGSAAQMQIVSGDDQTATVGVELERPLVVRVVDGQSRSVRGQLVNFRVTAGGGSVFAGASITSADGIAQERWTLGTVARDTQRVEARAVDNRTGAAIVFSTFTAVATAAAPAEAAKVNAGTLSGAIGSPLADSLEIRVTDRFGNGVPDMAVAWNVLAGGGIVSPVSSTTNANGVAKSAWTLGTQPGTPQIAEGRAGSLAPARFTATATTLPATKLSTHAGDHATAPAGSTVALAARATDALGNGVLGTDVIWRVLSGGGSLHATTSSTNAQGVAEIAWTLGSSTGEQSAQAAVQGLAGSPTTFTVTATAAAATPVRYVVNPCE